MKNPDDRGAGDDGQRWEANRTPVDAGGWRWCTGAMATLGCLAATVVHMNAEWTLNETYHYGWLVPLLAGYLFLVRWRDRPPARPPAGECITAWVAAGLALMVVWIIREANPEWRLVGLGLAGVTVAVALAWLRAAGGWSWVSHFAGSVGFLFLAAPWPTPLETAVTQPLMAANAGLALEALHWLGVPASRSGSLINVPGATLGVEEACSGIRSLQATVMMALFLGELGALRWRRRVLLLGLGVATALVTNVGRTVWLSALAAGPTPGSADRWHDTAGILVLGIHAAVLLVAAHRLGPPAGLVAAQRGGGDTPAWPQRGPAVILGCLALLLPIAGWWFSRQAAMVVPAWNLVPPESAPQYEVTPIPSRTRQILRYDTGWSSRWRTEAGHQLQAYYLTWRAGQAPPEILHSHEPGNCLALAGMTYVRSHDEPLGIPTTPGRTVSARCLEFLDHGRPLFVFHAVEETGGRGLEGRSAEGLSHRSRVRAAWLGRRSEGLRLIEIGIWNAATAEEARTVVAHFLREHIDPE